MVRRLSWTSSVCLAHLLGGGLALLLAAGRALLLHDRVVDRGALLLVHAVALLLVHSLALTVLQISLKIGAKLDKNLGFHSLAKLLTCSCVQICSWTVVHCGSLVVEHFCSFTVSHFCRDGTKGQSNIFKRVFLFFDLFVDGLSDGVALLLRPLLALWLVLRAAHTVLHGLALLPAKNKDIT